MEKEGLPHLSQITFDGANEGIGLLKLSVIDTEAVMLSDLLWVSEDFQRF